MTLTAVCSSTGTLCTSLPEERDASPHHHPGEKPPESLSLNIARLHVRGVCQEEEARGAAVARGPEALRGNQQDAGRGELGQRGHRGDEEREDLSPLHGGMREGGHGRCQPREEDRPQASVGQRQYQCQSSASATSIVLNHGMRNV